MKSCIKKMKKQILSLLMISSFVFLAACGGADNPYLANVPGGGSGRPGGGSGSENPPPPGAGSACLVKLKEGAKLSIRVKISPSDRDPDADAEGVLSFPETSIPELKFRFSGETVVMDSSEFPEVSLNAFGSEATAIQKSGTRATGPYVFETGSVIINNTILSVTAPIVLDFPAASLTTEPVEIIGSKGNLSDTGSRLNRTDKKITLVGGFIIPDGLHNLLMPKYSGVAVIIKIEGEFDTIPDPAQCSGSVDGPVSFREVRPATGAGTSESEAALASNTLNMGSVYVPEAGVDNPNPAVNELIYNRFHKTKTLRVKNNQTTAISGSVANTADFSISPSTYTIAPGATQDFVITFAYLSISNYSLTNVPITKNVTGSFVFGPSTVNVSGIAKRAAPEMVVTSDSESSSTIDFGTIPVRITGSGPSTRMSCLLDDDSSAQAPALLKRFSIVNRGVRDLNIQNILAPIDTDTDTQVDCLRGLGGQEFIRLALDDASRHGSRCNRQVVGGHEYLTDQCRIPANDGVISFSVAYIPKNVNTIIDTAVQDTARMTIGSDDPAYATTPYTLNFKASVSKDVSNLLAIQKRQDTSSTSSTTCSASTSTTSPTNFTRVFNNGSLRINLAESEASKAQVFQILNNSSERLEDVSVQLEGEASNRAAFSVQTPPTLIPPMVSTQAATVDLPVVFTKPSGATAGSVYPVNLKVTYTPASTKTTSRPAGTPSTFTLQLAGSVGLDFPDGNYKVNVQVFSAYLKSTVTVGLSSLDYRMSANQPFASGPLNLSIRTDCNRDRTGTIRSVTVEVPTNPILNPLTLSNADLAGLSREARRNLIRIFTSKNSICRNGQVCPDGEVPECNDPESISGPYRAGDCSYFYYVMGQDTRPGMNSVGTFNTETGSLILPNVIVKSLNPYHKAEPMPGDFKPDDLLQTTITTTRISGLQASDGTVLVPTPGTTIPLAAGEFSSASNLPPCPAGWDPRIPYSESNPNASPKPTLSCFFDRGPSGSGDGYLQGRSAAWFVDNSSGRPVPKQTMGVVMIMKYADDPANLAIFLRNANMWAGMQGTLERVAP